MPSGDPLVSHAALAERGLPEPENACGRKCYDRVEASAPKDYLGGVYYAAGTWPDARYHVSA